jgi:hypothetical protein
MSEILRGLEALESKFRLGGVDGVYGFLDLLGQQTLGVRQTPLAPAPIVKAEPAKDPEPEPEPEPKHEAGKHGGNHTRR